MWFLFFATISCTWIQSNGQEPRPASRILKQYPKNIQESLKGYDPFVAQVSFGAAQRNPGIRKQIFQLGKSNIKLL